MSEESKPAKASKGIKASDLLEIATKAYVEAVEAESVKPDGNLERAIENAKQAAAAYVNQHHDGKGATLAQEAVAIIAYIGEYKNRQHALVSAPLKPEVKEALRKALEEPEQQFTTRCEEAFGAFKAAEPDRAKAAEASKFESIAMEKLQAGVRDFVANNGEQIKGAIMSGNDPKDAMFADAVTHAREYALKDQTKTTLMAQAQKSGNPAHYFKSYIAAVNSLADGLVNAPPNAPGVKALKAIFDAPQQSAEVASPSSGAPPFLADDSPAAFSFAEFQPDQPAASQPDQPAAGGGIALDTSGNRQPPSRRRKDGWGKTILGAALGIAATAGGIGVYSGINAPATDNNNPQANVRRVEDDGGKEAERPAPRPRVANNNPDANPGAPVPRVPDKAPAAPANPAGAGAAVAGAPAAPMPEAPAGEMPAPAAPMPEAPAAAPAPAAVGGEVADPATLADADLRKKYFEDFVASRVVDVSPDVVKRGFIEKIDGKFLVKRGCAVDFFRANDVGDWVWAIHNSATHDTLIMPSASSNLHIAAVADERKNSFHLEVLNGRERKVLQTPEGVAKSYSFPATLPPHRLHQTADSLFAGGIPGICIAASYKADQVKPGTTHVLDNARSQRPEIELRFPLNNQVVYLQGGVVLNLENPMALPLSAPVAAKDKSARRVRGDSTPDTPSYISGLQDFYVAVGDTTAASIIRRPMGTIDTDLVDGLVGFDAGTKVYLMLNPRALGLGVQIPIATTIPTGDTGQKIHPNASNHIGGYVLLNPAAGTSSSIMLQIGNLRPATIFAGGPSAGLQGSSVRQIIQTSDQMLQPKAEPYTLNELALEVARWGREPDQLADVLQKASYAFDHKLRVGSFGRDDASISLGVGDPTFRQLTNLTEPYDPDDPVSKTLIEKYRETCRSLVIEATKRAEETVKAAEASADPFERAKLMGFYRPEDPVDGTPDAEAKKIKDQQRLVDRQVSRLIEFATKPVGRATKETGDVLLKYMLEYWLPREGQLIINPGQHDNGIHLDDGVPIKTASLDDGARVRTIASANVSEEMQDHVAAVKQSTSSPEEQDRAVSPEEDLAVRAFRDALVKNDPIASILEKIREEGNMQMFRDCMLAYGNGSDVRNNSTDDGLSVREALAANAGRRPETRHDRNLADGLTGMDIPRDPMGDFTRRLREQQADLLAIKPDEQNRGPRGRYS